MKKQLTDVFGYKCTEKKNWYIVTCFWEQNDMKTIKMSKFELIYKC